MVSTTSQNRAAAWTLSPRQWEWVGKLVAITLLGFFSPTWYLLKSVLESYMDVNALTSMQTALPVWMDFVHRLKDPHSPIAGELIGQLLLCLMVSMAYLYFSGKLGTMAVRWFLSRQEQKLNSEV